MANKKISQLLSAGALQAGDLIPISRGISNVALSGSEILNLVSGLWDDRGNYDASSNLFPSTGGSGVAGAILKGDLWQISVAGILGGNNVEIGDVVRALIDTPVQTVSNWGILQNNIGYTAENQANKENTTLDTSVTKYPTNRLAKEYADAISSTTTANLALKVTKAGEAGGQTIIGGIGAGEDLVLESTSHTTKGRVKILDKLNLSVGAEINEFSTDGTLAGDSDLAVPTEKAIKFALDNLTIDEGSF